jgi:hypothetical protein
MKEKTRDSVPVDKAARFERLFNREKFTRRTLKVYRVAGPMVLGYFALSMLNSSGLFPGLSMDDLPHWLRVIIALLTYGIALATPILFVIASVGGFAVKSDWIFALPLWLFSSASGMFLVTVYMAGALSPSDQYQVWTIASLFLLLSAALATLVGYRRRTKE